MRSRSRERSLSPVASGWDTAGSDPNVNTLTGRPFSQRYYSILQTRKRLPAWEAKTNFLKLVKRNTVLILVGETGSGKTTQCAQFLIEAGMNDKRCIAVTQPRRVAAMSVAKRVAEELDVTLGQHVGYSIRFEDKSSHETIIKYMTDGMLLREAMSDKDLKKYSIVILDEAHERTLNTDVLFGVMKNIINSNRKDLKLIVMSATLDSGKFQEYFNNAPILNIPGRLHPVEILYTQKPEDDYTEGALRTVMQIHKTEGDGDILLFLTGEDEIEETKRKLDKECAKYNAERAMVVVPLYSSLPPHAQQRIFETPRPPMEGRKRTRKCVVSTNIAETSLTIDGIVYVVDPGFSKQKVYQPRTRQESLLVSPISKASAAQRAGRAGRTQPGKCFRLYTKIAFDKELPEQTYPEILRTNISNVVLNLKKLGIDDLVHFDFMDPPAPETMMRALEELHFLGAIDSEGDLTTKGKIIAEFPLEPLLGNVVVEAHKHSCAKEAVALAAILSVPNMFMRPPAQAKEADDRKAQFISDEGDHFTMLNAFYAYIKNRSSKDWCQDYFLNYRSLSAAENIQTQLDNVYHRHGLPYNSTPPQDSKHILNLQRALLEGYFMHAAFREPRGMYCTLREEQVVSLHPSSVLAKGANASWVLFHEFVLTGRSYIRTCSSIRPEWLFEVCPDYVDDCMSEDSQTARQLLKVDRLRNKVGRH